MAAAIPALGFLVMVKIALAHSGTAAVVRASGPAVVEPAAEPTPHATTEPKALETPAPAIPSTASPPTAPAPAAVRGPEPDRVVQVLVPAARKAAEVLHSKGLRVTRKALAELLRSDGYGVSNERLGILLKEVAAEMGDKMSPTGLADVRPPIARGLPDVTARRSDRSNSNEVPAARDARSVAT